jgi:hypothetical protein
MTNSSVYASPVTAKEWRVNSNNMAARRKAPCSSEDLFCSICEVGFPFRSKYKRHLAHCGDAMGVMHAAINYLPYACTITPLTRKGEAIKLRGNVSTLHATTIGL